MDKYHIYEEIGKGAFSQVFKGREKKSIEYVAIKRVDKNMMNNVVNEVQIMHRLESPHTVKFHDWYETKNNLWLILEYCTAGDLESLLKQDHHLPEASVRMFALDIITGLRYLHTLGYVHCDLRPKNILIDEYGILKISDFKMTRKIPKAALGNQPLSSRGTVLYMAPELFSSEGVHSFASDFWALGCVLFELRVGGGLFSCRWWKDRDANSAAHEDMENTADIMDNIRTKELSAIILRMVERSKKDRARRVSPRSKSSQKGNSGDETGYVPSMTPELSDLIGWMVEKTPHYRCNWEELCSHPFWDTKCRPSPPQLLPPQPAYEALISCFQDSGSLADDSFENSVCSAESSRVEYSGVQGETKGEAERAEDYNSSRDYMVDEGAAGHQNESKVDIESSRTCEDVDDADDRFNPITHMVHASDSQVKPIVNNKAIEPIEKFVYTKGASSSSLQFSPLSVGDLGGLSQTEIENHLSQVYKSLQQSVGMSSQSSSSRLSNTASVSQATERMNILSYLCTIASNAEVANMVLNTQFLSLLLHVIKTSPSKAQLSQSQRSNQTSVRALAATALALFLRYATYIEPPSTSTRDSHILSVLVQVLKDTTGMRMDVQLRHRALAALGELVFYISAQDDHVGSGWELPSGVVGVIAKGLGEDGDEVVRHYAAKTIENILAQGSYPIRKQFISLEVASRLLDLSQHSRNTTIQAVCAMALFHMFFMVLQEAATTTGGSSPAPGGARFISRILEKGGLSNFIDTLKDGRPRLQQAYLNIFNIIFSANHIAPSPSPGNTVSSPTDEALKAIRFYFVQECGQLLPVLCRLAEQGSSSAIKGKAILAIELMCRFHPSVAISLSDCRFQNLLGKLLEQEDISRFGGTQELETKTSTYVIQCAVSMQKYLRHALSNSLVQLVSQLKNDTQLSAGVNAAAIEEVDQLMQGCDLISGASSGKNAYSTPMKGGSRGREAATPMLSDTPMTGRTSPVIGHNPSYTSKRGGSSSPGHVANLDIHQRAPPTASASRVSECSAVLRACLSMTAHHALRRAVMSTRYVQTLSAALSLVGELMKMPNRGSDDVVSIAEQAVLLALESVAQLDLDSSTSTPTHLSSSCMKSLLTQLIPSVVSFCGACDGDARVIIMFSLRKLLPALVRLYESAAYHEIFMEKVLKKFPTGMLLQDEAPIPQYTVRLLAEVAAASPSTCSDIAVAMSHFESDAIEIFGRLLDLLKGSYGLQSNSDRNSAPSPVGDLPPDPQVAVLLKLLIASSSSFNDKSAAALPGAVFKAGMSHVLVSCTAAAVEKLNAELVVVLLELMLVCVDYADHFNNRTNSSSHTSEDAMMEDYLQKNMVHIISVLCQAVPSVIEVLSWPIRHSDMPALDSTMMFLIHDSGASCLNVLIDMMPSTVMGIVVAHSKGLARALCNRNLDMKVTEKVLKFVRTIFQSCKSGRQLLDLKQSVLTVDVVAVLTGFGDLSAARGRPVRDKNDHESTVDSLCLLSADILGM
mmetsp:Transcript_12206/g.18439  ORF Transcript_12206/g.18439 Transcript_12206/m.18439 type:complete len:1492 (+) Transcript_12206:184-4659(+)|eukprot:CAMPEP_0185031928 /NCGR_PEP_ID=MMETSP1103-20130426/19674_1 /TAXON_ID=36769 /ORGANISM="Paraphysomonas bandaiensis, Strain Caron Lab Isolate" /LENGTH=1491 /DNA_ID=CAMNT_0027567627 /DNA_START=170 /DNA_END=4645 /DNA_ORIENTATION=+